MRGISVGFLIARLIASGMLLLALSRHPYSYYILLRWVVCGTAAYGAFKSIELEKEGWAWVLGFMALLFNPIVPVHLSREIWAPIDVISALILAVSIFTIRTKNEESNEKLLDGQEQKTDEHIDSDIDEEPEEESQRTVRCPNYECQRFLDASEMVDSVEYHCPDCATTFISEDGQIYVKSLGLRKSETEVNYDGKTQS